MKKMKNILRSFTLVVLFLFYQHKTEAGGMLYVSVAFLFSYESHYTVWKNAKVLLDVKSLKFTEWQPYSKKANSFKVRKSSLDGPTNNLI